MRPYKPIAAIIARDASGWPDKTRVPSSVPRVGMLPGFLAATRCADHIPIGSRLAETASG